MCGIFCSVCKSTSAKRPTCSPAMFERLVRRGPDRQQFLQQKTNDDWEMEFLSTVLYLRGPEIIRQPVVDEQGNILLWNGEVFNGLEVSAEVNDTLLVFASLSDASDEDELLQIIKRIQGPWAFVFWQECTQKLWFGRDMFGRRSLLWNLSPNQDQFLLSSVLSKEDKIQSWAEVPAAGVYCLDFKSSSNSAKLFLKLYPWMKQIPCDSFETISCESLAASLPSQGVESCIVEEGCKLELPLGSHLNKALPELNDLDIVPTSVDFTGVSEKYSVVVKQFLDVLSEAVRLRVQAQPKMCQICLETWKKGTAASHRAVPSSHTDETSVSLKESSSDDSKDFLSNIAPCHHSKIGVLFSGGVDSCVLAALADRFVPLDEPIDLLNVAFQQKLAPSKPSRRRTRDQTSAVDSCTRDEPKSVPPDPYGVPDRISGMQGYEELRKINPQRKWNFVHINVTPNELKSEREAHVASVIAPSLTVLDDSIGCAVWFAARCSGFIKENEKEEPYTTPARVLLVGMGADEQLCGYSRHRVKFNMSGWKGLIEEIDIEINRISSRNLGRDDRVISDHGRESRLPFLDENVVSFINSLPICYKANLKLPRGTGEKILLRVAASALGLVKTAVLAKRAIQFGSRIAKAEDRCEKGSDVCTRLKV